MHRTLPAVVLAAAVLGCGGSSNNPSDPVAACKSVFTTVCNKVFQCNPSGAAQTFGTAPACASTLSANCNSNNVSCQSGTSYNASAAGTCINDIGNESCTDVSNGVTPASCNSSNICK